jgi:uncharacterized membrane protein
MPALLNDWLTLALRWVHVIAGIMWIGDSFLFMWMDSSLEPPSRPRQGDVAGELWMVHSGGFYEVVKRRTLAPAELPRRLYWFRWQAYTTWLSGFALLALIYWVGGAAYLVDRSVSNLGVGPAIGVSFGLLVVGWLLYQVLWDSPLGRRPVIAAVVSFALLVGATWGLTHLFSGRAAFIQIGAMLGTIMAGNVAHVIVPAQRKMLAATRAGAPADAALGVRAKVRSTHNHYLTLPVVFTMISSHFPASYAHPQSWLVLTLLMVVGVAAKCVMNDGLRTHRGILAAGATALIAVVTMTARVPGAVGVAHGVGGAPIPTDVAYATVEGIIQRRCLSCHASHPANPAFVEPPSGIVLEDPTRVHSLAQRIRVRVVETRTMPLGNLTGMTDAERDTVATWIAQGARAR